MEPKQYSYTPEPINFSVDEIDFDNMCSRFEELFPFDPDEEEQCTKGVILDYLYEDNPLEQIPDHIVESIYKDLVYYWYTVYHKPYKFSTFASIIIYGKSEKEAREKFDAMTNEELGEAVDYGCEQWDFEELPSEYIE